MTKKKMYNASNPEHIAEARQQDEFVTHNKVKLMQEVMGTLGGREFFYDLLCYCSAFNTPFTGEINTTNFNCGKQSVGFRLIADLEQASPENYVLMCREGKAPKVVVE